MIIIGERINSTRKTIREAIHKKDSTFLLKEAENQLLAGADFIDINCATSLNKETQDIIWLISETQKKFGCKISIDSPHPKTIEQALEVHKGIAFINSITLEKEKLETLLPVVKKSNCYIIVLTIDDKGMPEDIKQRIDIAQRIIEIATRNGISKDNIYIDPLTKPLSTEPEQANYFLETVKRVKDKGIKTIGGLSNVSFGLPKRHLINAVFLKLAIEAGINAVIIDPTDSLTRGVLDGKELPEGQSLLAKDLLLGKDKYALNYIKAFRNGVLD